MQAQSTTEEDPLVPHLVEVIRSPEFQTACIQRLVAASIDAAEGLRVMNLAIDRVREETRGPVPDLASRILRALEAACAQYAEMRCLPYKRVVGPMIRGWRTLTSFARQAGLTEEEGWALIRGVLRKIPSSHWARIQNVDRELLEELRCAFSVIGLARDRGPVAYVKEPKRPQELSHAFGRY